LRLRLRPTNDIWRVDETYIRVKGKWVYLYRAVDSSDATIDFLLSTKRDAAAAERCLDKALGGENHPAPRVINTESTPVIHQPSLQHIGVYKADYWGQRSAPIHITSPSRLACFKVRIVSSPQWVSILLLPLR
jgi:DDE domain